jgi:hypothetical protein
MVPPLLDASPSVDTEFDLDVRLQAVARDASDDRGEKPEPPGTLTGMTVCGQPGCGG